jgi:nicotinamidase-related amidase
MHTQVKGAVLLCLDLQPVFLKAVAGGPELIRRCSFAIEVAAGLGIPVEFTEQVPSKLGATEPSLLALAGSPKAHAKDTFSALSRQSPCRAALTETRELNHLLLCGLETPICVYQTALDALRADVAVTILSDCVGARRPDDARAALDSLARADANVLPSEAVFYSILGGASHPFFRPFTELVKKYA